MLKFHKCLLAICILVSIDQLYSDQIDLTDANKENPGGDFSGNTTWISANNAVKRGGRGAGCHGTSINNINFQDADLNYNVIHRKFPDDNGSIENMSGCGCYLFDCLNANFRGVSFSDNRCYFENAVPSSDFDSGVCEGVGLYMRNTRTENVDFSGAVFNNNSFEGLKCIGCGANIEVAQSSNVNMSNVSFINNSVIATHTDNYNACGAIIWNGIFDFEGAVFEGNSIDCTGAWATFAGGLVCGGCDRVSLINASFKNNIAINRASGIEIKEAGALQLISTREVVLGATSGRISEFSGNISSTSTTSSYNPIPSGIGIFLTSLINIKVHNEANGILRMLDPMNTAFTTTGSQVGQVYITQEGAGRWELGGNNVLMTENNLGFDLIEGELRLLDGCIINAEPPTSPARNPIITFKTGPLHTLRFGSGTQMLGFPQIELNGRAVFNSAANIPSTTQWAINGVIELDSGVSQELEVQSLDHLDLRVGSGGMLSLKGNLNSSSGTDPDINIFGQLKLLSDLTVANITIGDGSSILLDGGNLTISGSFFSLSASPDNPIEALGSESLNIDDGARVIIDNSTSSRIRNRTRADSGTEYIIANNFAAITLGGTVVAQTASGDPIVLSIKGTAPSLSLYATLPLVIVQGDVSAYTGSIGGAGLLCNKWRSSIVSQLYNRVNRFVNVVYDDIYRFSGTDSSDRIYSLWAMPLYLKQNISGVSVKDSSLDLSSSDYSLMAGINVMSQVKMNTGIAFSFSKADAKSSIDLVNATSDSLKYFLSLYHGVHINRFGCSAALNICYENLDVHSSLTGIFTTTDVQSLIIGANIDFNYAIISRDRFNAVVSSGCGIANYNQNKFEILNSGSVVTLCDSANKFFVNVPINVLCTYSQLLDSNTLVYNVGVGSMIATNASVEYKATNSDGTFIMVQQQIQDHDLFLLNLGINSVYMNSSIGIGYEFGLSSHSKKHIGSLNVSKNF